MSFLFMLFTVFTFNKNIEPKIEIKWEDTIVEIPLGKNLDEYIEIPFARLYIDDVEQIDEVIHYQRNGVDHTFLTVINTNIVNTHNIRYKVTFPNHNISSKMDIKFMIIDNIAPIIDYVPAFSFPLKTKLPTLLEGLRYRDNYSSEEKIIVTILGKEKININVVGRYKIIYQVKDESFNTNEMESFVDIYDDESPIIKLEKELLLDFDKLFDVSNYFKITDNYDSLLLINLDDRFINYKKIGSYSFSFEVKDQSDNKTSYNGTIHIVDRMSPEIVISSSLNISFNDAKYMDKLENFILSISDNYDVILKSDVLINTNLDINRLGSYDVIYIANDSSNNNTTKKVIVKVIDDERPVIRTKNDLIIDVFANEPNWSIYFIISDNYDNYNALEIKFSTTINFKIVGSYSIIVEVIDTNKNKTKEIYDVLVVDIIKPSIVQNNELIIYDFLEKDFSKYFTYTDNYDKQENLFISIDDSSVDYKVIGEYKVLVSVIDRSNNETIIETIILIIDKESPILEIIEDSISIEVNSDNKLFFDEYIVYVFDNYTDVKINDVIISFDINYNVVGIYEILFEISDSSLNKTKKTLLLKIVDNEPPVITVENLITFINSNINLYDGIMLSDNYDSISTLTNNMKVFNKNFDISTKGIKKIKYLVTDSSGNIAETVRIIEVIENKTINKISYMPYIVIAIISLFSIFYVIKKK